MLIEADASGLEIVCAAYLSQDPVLLKEIWGGVDLHTNNQDSLKLPERVIAKIFIFRILFGGNEWSFANDPDFNWISRNPKYWKNTIDLFYDKYQGIYKWHNSLINEVQLNGGYTSPTGRKYSFEPVLKHGDWLWPITTIKNYIVQGFGADLMSIARVSAKRRLKDKVLFVATVHDSIVVDSPNKIVYDVCDVLENVFVDIPKNFKAVFGQEFNLPMKGEVMYGPCWAKDQMTKFKRI